MGVVLQLGEVIAAGTGAAEATATTTPRAAAAPGVWHAAAAAATADEGEYFEVSIDEEDFVLLTDPVPLWSSKFCVPSLPFIPLSAAATVALPVLQHLCFLVELLLLPCVLSLLLSLLSL